MLNPVINSSGYNRLVKKISSQSVVECRFPQSSDITEVIAVQPQLSLVMCEASSGRVNYAGKLILTVVYSDEEGKLCRMQKGAEFSHFADDDELAPSNICACKLMCVKLNVKREGSSFVISAIIGADITVYARRERSIVSAAEGAYTRCDSVSLPSIVCFSGESEVDDEFDADSVVDILMPSAKAVVLSACCGTGEVEITGEIYLSLFSMRQQNPTCMERIIPFKCTLPCEDASAGIKACASAEISDLNVNAKVNEEKGKCEINLTCGLNFSGWLCDLRTEEVALDAFSDTHKINANIEEESYSRCIDIKVYGERVTSLAASKARLTYDCTFLAAALPSSDCVYNEQTNAVEGAVTTTLIYAQNGEIKSTEVTMPVAVTLNGVCESGQFVDVDIAVCGVTVRLKAEGEAEAEATLKISACVTEECKVKYISALEEGEQLEVNDCAVSVFLPAAGDGLWDVAKKLNKNPSDVAACNRELNFPLSGKERILIYRGRKA